MRAVKVTYSVSAASQQKLGGAFGQNQSATTALPELAEGEAANNAAAVTDGDDVEENDGNSAS